jgi:predicted nucleotidyltransferase
MPDKNAVADAVKKALLALYGERFSKLILYGSYARGDQKEGSDFDFLVVLKDTDIKTGTELRYMNSALYDLDMRFNTSISVNPASLQRYVSSDYLYFQNIRREGIEI